MRSFVRLTRVQIFLLVRTYMLYNSYHDSTTLLSPTLPASDALTTALATHAPRDVPVATFFFC